MFGIFLFKKLGSTIERDIQITNVLMCQSKYLNMFVTVYNTENGTEKSQGIYK